MRYARTRTALAIAGTATLVYLLGCASAPRHDPLYDGDVPNLVTQSDSVAIYIDNTRSRDMTDPVFYLIGNGRHSLGRVPDLSKRKVTVDRRWLTGADGTFQVVVHYVGIGDLYYDRIVWRPGDSVYLELSTLFSPISLWTHR